MSKDKALTMFIRESNRIEGIFRPVMEREYDAHARFLDLPIPTIENMSFFVAMVAPTHVLRSAFGINVRVGSHVPPPGGPAIRDALDNLLKRANDGATPHAIHCAYEALHPFTDGNGRSGRALWLWMMKQHGRLDEALERGFLHSFYYQTLEAFDKDSPAHD